MRREFSITWWRERAAAFAFVVATSITFAIVSPRLVSTASAEEDVDPVVRAHVFQDDAGLQLGSPLSLDVTPEALYFTADSAGMGREVWRVTGRTAAAEFLRDTVPGPGGIDVGYYLVGRPADAARTVGSDIWYRRGSELWHADAAGSLGSVTTGSDDSGATARVALGRVERTTLLSIDAPIGERDSLWVHDATDGSTALLREFAIGGAGSGPGQSAQMNDFVLFAASDAERGRELWRSDGTIDGTTLVLDIASGGASSNPRPLLVVGDTLLFFADGRGATTDLWRTDGTGDGTSRIRDGVAPVASLQFAAALYDPARPDAVPLPDGAFVFVAESPDGSRGLWETDGTTAEPVAGLTETTTDPRLLGVVDGVVVFSDEAGAGRRLFGTDAAGGPAALLANVNPEAFGPHRHLDTVLPPSEDAPGGALLFVADDGAHGREIWRTDGTVGGTRMVIDLEPGAGTPFRRPFLPNSQIYRGMGVAFDGVVWFDAYGTLYQTDGTAAGTYAVHVYDGDERVTSAAVAELTPRGDNLYALVYGTESSLFVRDPDVGGMTATLQPFGRTDSAGLPAPIADLADSLLVFTVESQPSLASRLWRLDDQGLDLLGVLPLSLGRGGFAYSLGWQDELLYFASHATFDDALWRTDGSTEGTFALRDGRPLENVDLDGVTYVVMRITQQRYELIRTDGTVIGTSLVSRRDLAPAVSTSSPRGLTAFGGSLFFSSGEDASAGSELWISDGTDEGTELFLDFLPGSAGSSPSGLIVLGDRLVFTAIDAFRAPRMLRSMDVDGNVTTVRDADEKMHSPGAPVLVGTSLFFVAESDAAGRELWTTDGTNAGTRLVRDIAPGSAHAEIAQIVRVDDDRIVFVAATGARGVELWTSDGTAAGTRRVTDIAPGPASSNPGRLTVHDGRVFFAASRRGEPMILYSIAIADLADVPETADEAPVPVVLADRFDPPPYVPPPVEPPPEPEPEPDPETLELKALHVRLPSGAPVRDTLKLIGRLPIPEGFDPTGAAISIDIGGVPVAWTLDKRGRSEKHVDGHRFRIDIDRSGRGAERTVRGNPRAKFSLKLAKSDLRTALDDEDLRLPDGEKQVERDIEVRVLWNGIAYATTATVRYKERRRVGIARLR